MQTTLKKQYKWIHRDVFDYLMAHPIDGLPRILGYEETEDGFTTEEEWIEGRTLYEVLQEQLMDRFQACETAIKICDILQQLHAVGLVHGDLKPENILLDAEGKVYLIDFDASHFEKNAIGHDTVLLGTPGFAAPEQFGFDRSDHRADIYAMGELLNVMMTGAFVNRRLPKDDVKRVIRKCVALNAKERYQTVASLRKDLLLYAKRRPKYRPFLPPGFRTMKPWKIVIAVLVYAGLGALTLVLTIDEKQSAWSVAWTWIYRVCWWLFCLAGILIFNNYLNINEVFPFARRNFGLRVLSKLLQFIILFGFIILVLLIFSITLQ